MLIGRCKPVLMQIRHSGLGVMQRTCACIYERATGEYVDWLDVRQLYTASAAFRPAFVPVYR